MFNKQYDRLKWRYEGKERVDAGNQNCLFKTSELLLLQQSQSQSQPPPPRVPKILLESNSHLT
jgi:hypothetical protein